MIGSAITRKFCGNDFENLLHYNKSSKVRDVYHPTLTGGILLAYRNFPDKHTANHER